MVTKFLPFMGMRSIHTLHDISVLQNTNSTTRVCARHGVAGIGMLTDHGLARHGQNLDDYFRIPSIALGNTLYAFRSFMLRNVRDLEHARAAQPFSQPFSILFSKESSNQPSRLKSFEKQVEHVKAAFSSSETLPIEVKAIKLASLTLKEQVQLVSDASVFVSVTGGSTSIATTLPRGASVILYFDDTGDFVGRSRKRDFPSMLDFGLWNSLPYLRLHWLPISTMDSNSHLELLVSLIRNELSTLKRWTSDEVSSEKGTVDSIKQ